MAKPSVPGISASSRIRSGGVARIVITSYSIHYTKLYDTAIELRPARADDAADIARLSDQLGYPASTGAIAQRLTSLLAVPRDNAA